MLSIYDRHPISRRELLRIGALGLSGLSLPGLFATRAGAGNENPYVTGKSVIFLFQQGGPSQFETFDPKPLAASGIRTVTGTTQTALPGVVFGDTMSQLAVRADELTIVRSYQTNNGGHNIEPIVGPDSLNTNIGVHYARVVGPTQARSGMPTTSVIYPAAVDDDVPAPQARGDLLATGTYGSAFAPFVPGGGGQLQQNMQLNLPAERLIDDRRALLAQLDRIRRDIDSSGQLETLDELQRQAYELLLSGGVAEALDLAREDPQTLTRYDTSRYHRPGYWNKVRRGQAGYYDANAKTIGHLLCLARRLCEAGCRFVTIHAGFAGVWDMHADGNNLNMVDGMQAVGHSFDHAVAAFVEDLKSRGLEHDILLIASGEMGRTPRINRRGGRDHWSRLAPLLMYGGGLPAGVIGQSTRDGGEPAGEPLTPANLISTIMRTVFNVSELRLVPGVPSQIVDLAGPAPIA